MGAISDEKAEVIAREFMTNGMNKTKALRAAGYADPNADCTRTFDNPVVQSKLRRAEDEYRAAMGKIGLGPEEFAQGLKRGMKKGNPATLRLYAEIVKLIGNEREEQVVVKTVQMFIPIVAPFIAEEKRGAFMAKLRELSDQHRG